MPQTQPGAAPNPTLAALRSNLRALVTPEGVQASGWQLFKGAVFGRDSLQVGLDVYAWYPAIARTIIVSAARWQGLKHDPDTEEEPGRIHHERRSRFVRGRPVGPQQEALIAQLSAEYGIGDEDGYTYYGTVDATLQYIRLVAAYCRKYGPGILDLELERYSGERTNVHATVELAARWVAGRLRTSELGLLEFRRTNERTHNFWHVLRDGACSYRHGNGKLANMHAPLASVEVQGLAYDALFDAAQLLGEAPVPDWRELAGRLRARTLELMWMERDGYFAMGLDRDSLGRPRQIAAVASLPGELLETRLFDGLPEGRTYVEAIVRRLFADDLLTSVGVRPRSLGHASEMDYADYQGPLVSWPVMSGIVARGLRRQGLAPLARVIEERYLAGMAMLQGYPEYFFVDEDGRLNAGDGMADSYEPPICTTNSPELTQAWSVSAAIRAVKIHARDAARATARARPALFAARPTSPPRAIPVSELRDNLAFMADIMTRPNVRQAAIELTRRPLDLEAGRARERAYLRSEGVEFGAYLGAA